jgi:hypothetical protein
MCVHSGGRRPRSVRRSSGCDRSHRRCPRLSTPGCVPAIPREVNPSPAVKNRSQNTLVQQKMDGPFSFIWLALPLAASDASIVKDAVRRARRYPVSYVDAQVVAAARSLACGDSVLGRPQSRSGLRWCRCNESVCRSDVVTQRHRDLFSPETWFNVVRPTQVFGSQ